MKILVTGTSGFIGAHFYEHIILNNLEHEWSILDRKPFFDSIHFNIHSAVREINVDLTSTFLHKFLDEIKPDIIINFAAETHVDNSIEAPGPFIQSNVVGTSRLLDWCAKNGIKNFHQVSTDEVYGSLALEDPSFTEDTPLCPNNPYAASKAAADLLVQSYAKTYNFNYSITRCCNNFGKYQSVDKLLPKIKSVLKKVGTEQLVPIYDKGLQIREWIHANDHCEAVYKAALRGGNQIYNIGTGLEISNKEMIELFNQVDGAYRLKIDYVKDPRPFHDFRYSIDSSKANRELSWLTTAEETKTKLINYIKE